MTESFIFTQYIEDLSLCDDIIEWYHDTERKSPGTSGRNMVRESIKKSTDACLNDNLELLNRYYTELRRVSDAYIEKFKYANYYNPWDIVDATNVQHYKPSEAYYGWHTERCGILPPGGSRHLVYMTYLNDVDDDGETEFYYQDVKFKPKKGLTLIWPADWTHTHRGIPSKTQDKYILTGWYNYTR